MPNGQIGAAKQPSKSTSISGTQTVARVDIDAVADCPSGFNRWVIQQRLDRYLNGRHNVRASGMDLDIWIPFFEEDDQVETDLEVRFVVDGVFSVASTG